MNFDMYKMMTSDEVVASGINKLSESEQQEILRWGYECMAWVNIK